MRHILSVGSVRLIFLLPQWFPLRRIPFVGICRATVTQVLLKVNIDMCFSILRVVERVVTNDMTKVRFFDHFYIELDDPALVLGLVEAVVSKHVLHDEFIHVAGYVRPLDALVKLLLLLPRDVVWVDSCRLEHLALLQVDLDSLECPIVESQRSVVVNLLELTQGDHVLLPK